MVSLPWKKIIASVIPAVFVSYVIYRGSQCAPSCGFAEETLPAIGAFVVVAAAIYLSYTMIESRIEKTGR